MRSRFIQNEILVLLSDKNVHTAQEIADTLEISVISINRTNEILPDNSLKPVLIIDYDYNTVFYPDKMFGYKDLEYLMDKSIEYKEVILNYGDNKVNE